MTAAEQPPAWQPALTLYRSLVQTFDNAVGMVALGLTHEVGMMPLNQIHPDATQALAGLLRLIDQQVIEQPEWILLSTQGYSATVQRSQLAAVEHGELQELHDIGMPNIVECIVVVMWHHSGDHWTATQAFSRESLGIVWAEPELLADTTVYSENDQVLHDIVQAP